MRRFNRTEYKNTHYIEPRKPFIIDQVALQIPVEYLRMENKSHYQVKRPDITIHEGGGVKYIHFHDACFRSKDYSYSIIQNIFDAIDYNVYDPHPIFKRRMDYYEILSVCKLRVIEFAFDSYDSVFPYIIDLNSGSFRKCHFKNKPPTIYSTDNIVEAYQRRGDDYDDSFICVYDRANKIGSNLDITRLEFRLKDRFIRGLSINDLKLTPLGISTRAKPIIIRNLKECIQPNSIKPLNSKILHLVHPYLYSILKEFNRSYSQSPVNYNVPTLILPTAASK